MHKRYAFLLLSMLFLQSSIYMSLQRILCSQIEDGSHTKILLDSTTIGWICLNCTTTTIHIQMLGSIIESIESIIILFISIYFVRPVLLYMVSLTPCVTECETEWKGHLSVASIFMQQWFLNVLNVYKIRAVCTDCAREKWPNWTQLNKRLQR